MEGFAPSPSGSDNGGREIHHRVLGKEPMGESFTTLMATIEVVHLSKSDSSQNVLNVIWSLGLENLVGRHDDDGDNGEEVASYLRARVPSSPYDIMYGINHGLPQNSPDANLKNLSSMPPKSTVW